MSKRFHSKPILSPPQRAPAGSFTAGKPPIVKSSVRKEQHPTNSDDSNNNSIDSISLPEKSKRSHNPFGSVRRYDLALKLTGVKEEEKNPIAKSPESSNNASSDQYDETVRPPPGAPTIRPSVHRQHQVPPDLDDLLQNTANSLLLVAEPDGATAFDISIRDDVFDELACRIAIRDHTVTATFRVADTNLRRLLEAEAGRLRAQLSDRGFKVDQIIICEAED
ncbi:MAG: hypothetical protein JW841_05370 [Deltaproteobacteria bacterium]|nr:hypothetical protein [Deltaproteobacteria bacterium]